MRLTRLILKRPVATVVTLLYLLVFGISSVFSAALEQMPDIDTPMLVVMRRYSGTGLEDTNELVIEPTEDEISTLEGVENTPSSFSDGHSVVMLGYDYGMDVDEAYDGLKKKLDSPERQSPDDVGTSVMEVNNGASSTTILPISHRTEKSLCSYMDQKVVPGSEKITSVADAEAMGGSSGYIRIELQFEKMAQCKLTMNRTRTTTSTVSLSYPSSDAIAGNLEPSVITSVENDTLDNLKHVPITTSNGQVMYLEDAANTYEAEEQRGNISGCDGQETIPLSISGRQSSTAMDMSSAVQKTIVSLKAADEDPHTTTARDMADSILSSLQDVIVTVVLAVAVPAIIISVFFGDYKASLITGSSTPASVLLSLILITSFEFSLNVIIMSALVLGTGMTVNSSIVVLESCFRATDESKDKGLLGCARSALGGAGIALQFIIDSTATTYAVFIPLVFLQGMTGRTSRSLGYTIVLCMGASLFSVMTVVPLSYMMYKLGEMEKVPMSHLVAYMQSACRRIMPGLLRHKILVVIASVAVVIATLVLVSGMETGLMTSDDTGTVSVPTEIRPGLLTDQASDMLSRIEGIVAPSENMGSYMLRYNNSNDTIAAYLKDDRTMDMEGVAMLWREEVSGIDNYAIAMEVSTSMSFMGKGRGYETILRGAQYDELKKVDDKIIKEITVKEDVANAHSSIENTTPIVTIEVDSVMATAEGPSPSEIGSTVSQVLDGMGVTTLDIDGWKIDVMAEYPKEEYRTVSQLRGIISSKPSGGYVALVDVAEIYFEDGPASISKINKSYETTITADYTGSNVKSVIDSKIINPSPSGTTTTGVDSRDRVVQEEFSTLYWTIATVMFMVLVVMSVQPGPPKFPFMIMAAIPLSLAGSFGLLEPTDVFVNMTSLLEFLILIGTVVNNNVLYMDIVNQHRVTMDLRTALIEASAIRLRPILITSLIIILSMILIALVIGGSDSVTQGLAAVDIGGSTAGVLVTLFIPPVYYAIMNGNKKQVVLDT